jgi:hypothetical protein
LFSVAARTINETPHHLVTHLFIFVSCMQIGFHTALRLYVQLLPQCFVAVSANTQVTYILGRREELSKHNDTVNAANQWRPNGNF